LSVSCSKHCRTAAAWSGTRADSSRRSGPISTKQRLSAEPIAFDPAAAQVALVGHVEQAGT